MSIFKLPDLGEGLPDAEINQWHVAVGDVVKADQLMVSMETAKAVVDVPAPQSGKIKKLYGNVGDIIQTGAPLIEFESEGGSKDAGTVVGKTESSDMVIAEESATNFVSQTSTAQPKAIPAVRALAKTLGVDLSTVTASGSNGQITADDVKKASASPTSSSTSAATTSVLEGGTVEPLRGVRRAMAQAMSQSHAEVVPVTLMDDADIQAWAPGTDITARVLRAICFAAQKEPALNAHFNAKNSERILYKDVHIGIAMDSKDGLFVPVIQKAQTLSASDLRQQVNEFKVGVGDRSVPADKLKGSTIQLSNFGTFAGRYANPIIVPPIVAILGTGKIRHEAVVVNGEVVSHRTLPLSISIDHRAVTGGEAARFLAALIEDLGKVE